MELKLEKNIEAVVEINGELFINFNDSFLYQAIKNDKASFYIKSKNKEKEVKIRILKK